jgi:hypothetical protein
MITRRSRLASERGVTLIYMAIFITTGLLFTGLGRRYRPLVRRQGTTDEGGRRRGAGGGA